jgi:hypothetical protein
MGAPTNGKELGQKVGAAVNDEAAVWVGVCERGKLHHHENGPVPGVKQLIERTRFDQS